MTLRARLLWAVAAVAVVLVVAGFVTVRIVENHLLDQVDESLRNSRPIAEARGGPGQLWVARISNDGSVVTPDDLGLAATTSIPEPAITADIIEETRQSGEPVTVGSDDEDVRYRVLFQPGRPGGDGGGRLVARPLTELDSTVATLARIERVSLAVVLVALGLVTWWVVRLGVRPVRRMTETARAIAAGDLSQRVDAGDPHTEAGQLGIALNEMLTRIELSFDERMRAEAQLRRFVADASHELRTPVSTIRGYAELYRSGGLDEHADLADAMRRTEAESIRMGSLVDDLLNLARLDQGIPVRRDVVDVGVVADEVVRDAAAVDPTRSVSLDVDGQVLARADESRLRQVLSNLVGNALMHTPATSSVRVRVSVDDTWVAVDVEDDGPGMAPEDAQRAFERFYRADASRSRASGGSGLGLAIVQATVTAMEGTVALSSEPEPGTVVRVRLPSASAGSATAPATRSAPPALHQVPVRSQRPLRSPRHREVSSGRDLEPRHRRPRHRTRSRR